MTIYHAFEIILVGAVVGACSISVARRYLPVLREWTHLGPRPEDKNNAANNCGNSGCDGCSSGKQAQH